MTRRPSALCHQRGPFSCSPSSSLSFPPCLSFPSGGGEGEVLGTVRGLAVAQDLAEVFREMQIPGGGCRVDGTRRRWFFTKGVLGPCEECCGG